MRHSLLAGASSTALAMARAPPWKSFFSRKKKRMTPSWWWRSALRGERKSQRPSSLSAVSYSPELMASQVAFTRIFGVGMSPQPPCAIESARR